MLMKLVWDAKHKLMKGKEFANKYHKCKIHTKHKITHKHKISQIGLLTTLKAHQKQNSFVYLFTDYRKEVPNPAVKA